MVNPAITDNTEIKCPYCEEGFLEEMSDNSSITATTTNVGTNRELNSGDVGSDRALSLWGPILLGMIGGSSSRRRREEERDDDDDDELNHDHELDPILRRRRRSSAALLQLLQGLRAELTSETGDSGLNRDREGERERERDNVILINPFNQAIILHGSVDNNQNQNSDDSPNGGGGSTGSAAVAGTSLGDYFVGPGLEMLLQHLAENDPNRYGTPPAKKEAVEAMPTVTIDQDMIDCPVCLEDFEIGTGVKEIPCSHKFHSGCILPWLELHSSCPVCRFQMPVDESKASNPPPPPPPPPPATVTTTIASGLERTNGGSRGREDGGNGSRLWAPFQWPFNGLFSSNGSPRRNNSGSSSSSPPPPPPPPPHSSSGNPPTNEGV